MGEVCAWVLFITVCSDTVESLVHTFLLLSAQLSDCIPACVNGVCNMSLGICECSEGYTGVDCSSSPGVWVLITSFHNWRGWPQKNIFSKVSMLLLVLLHVFLRSIQSLHDQLPCKNPWGVTTHWEHSSMPIRRGTERSAREHSWGCTHNIPWGSPAILTRRFQLL